MSSVHPATAAGPTVALLPGDGVGPEVVAQARAVLEEACREEGTSLRVRRAPIGGEATDLAGDALPDETLALCRESDAVLLGAVGGPRWDHLRDHRRPGDGLLRLRRALGLFANLRPVAVPPAVAGRAPVRREVGEGTDLVIVRELTGGIYFGARGRSGSGPAETAYDSLEYGRPEIERVAEVAFGLAEGRRRRLVSVDKANVLETSRLWRDVVDDIAPRHPTVEVEHQLVDSCAMRLVSRPRELDVLLTENMLGDILSDEAAVLAGSLGMLPSASLGEGGRGLYEPVHGSAPDIAGRGAANPVGAILSAALLLEHSLGLPAAAGRVRAAVASVLEGGVVTADLGGEAGTAEVGEAVLAALGAARVTYSGATA